MRCDAVAFFAAVCLSLSWSCKGTTQPDLPPPSEDSGVSIALKTLPFAELELPDHSRPDDNPPPQRVDIQGPWKKGKGGNASVYAHETRVPIRPRGLFFFRPQPGMAVHDADGREIPYGKKPPANGASWVYDRRTLTVYTSHAAPPKDGAFTFSYERATQREAAQNLKWSAHDKETFAWSSIYDDWDSREGLLLPAPGVAAWDVEVPPAAALHFVAGLGEPELRGSESSDGADLIVEVVADGATTQVSTHPLAVRRFETYSADLSPWAGQSIRLRFNTNPRANPVYDYAFIGEPVIATRVANPIKVVMVFIDTLRPDHLGLYGYERNTTEAIDHLADSAAIFTQARSVAPWTLPSARTIVTGRHPEYFDGTPTLPRRLADRGWATAFIAGNVYLSSNFGMARDWGLHRVGLFPSAEEVTDDALEWLSHNDDRNAVIQLHYMDPHLPYEEPSSYRNMFAGKGPKELRETFHLSDVRRAQFADKPDAQQYLRDRYDNNIRYTTDQLQRVVETLDDNDILVIYSDHGEEFWDHNGFEHGHTLHDELLRVPLVVRAPGMPSGTFDTPVSLLDVTPTILDLLGISTTDPLDGSSLAPLANGQPDAIATFASRDLAFGRPLYGLERWGVLSDGQKWTTHEGQETLHDVVSDPGETIDLAAERNLEPYRAKLGAALGRETGIGYRITATRQNRKPVKGLWALCTVPGGFEHAWSGDDPLDRSAVSVRTITDRAEAKSLLDAYQIKRHALPDDMGAAVEFCWHAGRSGSREVYVVPSKPLDDVGHKMACSGFIGDRNGGQQGTMRIPHGKDPAIDGAEGTLANIQWPVRQLTWQHGIGPVPNAETQALEGRDDEVNAMLEAMGYVDPDAPEDGGSSDGESAPVAGGCEPPGR